MEISGEKSKILKMGTNEKTTVQIGGEDLETVDQFKYLGQPSQVMPSQCRKLR